MAVKNKSQPEIFATLSGLLFVAVVPIGLTDLIAHFFPAAGIFVYGGLIFVALILAIGGLLPDRPESLKDISYLEGLFAATGGVVIVVVVAAGQFFRFWNARFGGFIDHHDGYLGWTLYSVSWVLDNGLANLGQIYGWTVTDIQPVSWAARMITWVYNIAMDFLIIASFIKYVPPVVARWRKRQQPSSPFDRLAR